MRAWKPLSEPALLADVNFKFCTETQKCDQQPLRWNISGELSGLIMYSELKLTPTQTLTTHPILVDEDHQ